MKRISTVLLLCLLFAGLLAGAAGCNKASPEDLETQALAKKFIEEVFVNRNADAAMALVGERRTYGYMTREQIESTIQDDIRQKCDTPLSSLTIGKVTNNMRIPSMTDADKADGATEMVAWVVGSTYRCGTAGYDTPRTSIVTLMKYNGVWKVAKCTFYYGVDYWD